MTVISDQTRHAILAAYRDGEQPADIAARFGVHRKTVSRMVHRAGLPPRRPTNLIPEHIREGVLKDYADPNLTVREIAERHGVNPSTVTWIARRADVPRRQRATELPPAEDIAAMLREGEYLSHLEDKLRAKATRIKRVLTEAGYDPLTGQPIPQERPRVRYKDSDSGYGVNSFGVARREAA